MIKYLNENEKLIEVITNNITVVDFYATWCGPCRMLSPVLEEISNENIEVIKIDIDKFEELTRSFGIMSVPTLQIYKDKELKKQITGYLSKEELMEVIKNI